MVTLTGRFTRSITLVDDEPWAIDILGRAATSWDYTYQTARSAEEAIAVLEREPTPVVVTDLRMPGKGGVWLVQEIRRRWPATAILVITAGTEDQAALDCLRAGADFYFLKPIQLDEFQHALASAFRKLRRERNHALLHRSLKRQVEQRTRQIRSTFASAIDSLTRTLAARDPYTSGHALRVRDSAIALARAIDLPERQVQHVALAAKLHDIGKLGLPEVLLNKNGPLTPEERQAVREHPVIGERILMPIVRRRAVLAAVRGHHERYAGGGYPDGLVGEGIPLEARVLAVADAYDAMTTTRAYRLALPTREALHHLEAAAGSHLDPHLVRVFLKRVQG